MLCGRSRQRGLKAERHHAESPSSTVASYPRCVADSTNYRNSRKNKAFAESFLSRNSFVNSGLSSWKALRHWTDKRFNVNVNHRLIFLGLDLSRSHLLSPLFTYYYYHVFSWRLPRSTTFTRL